jgi:hypothetical protein
MQGFIDQGIRLPTSADADREEQVLWSWFDCETDRIIKAHYNQVECGPRWAALNGCTRCRLFVPTNGVEHISLSLNG